MSGPSTEAAGDRRDSEANRAKTLQLLRALDVALGESLRDGWFGRVRLDLAVMDGTMQNFALKAERTYR